MKRTYNKPQMMVESLLANEYFAANCDEGFINDLKNNGLGSGTISLDEILLGMALPSKDDYDGWMLNDANEHHQYCYNTSTLKVFTS